MLAILLAAGLAAVEVLLQDKGAIESSTRIPVMQVQPLEVPARPAARKAQKRAGAEKKPHKQASGRARVAEVP